MNYEYTTGYRWFTALNHFILIGLALLCMLPLVHILAISLSDNGYVASGEVMFWPKGFNWNSYRFAMERPEFIEAFAVTLKRVALGVSISMLLTLLSAYPLSKEATRFASRTAYVWYFVITILFGGGLIPTYIVVKETGLMDTIWALVIPNAVPVFNVVLMLNFFRSLPKELEESAFLDGGGHWTILWRIYVPLSMPSLATIGLFTIVGHWNAWFDGMIYSNFKEHYPLSTYLQTVIVNPDMTQLSSPELFDLYAKISDRTMKAAQIFLGMLPILLVYPFLQRFFIHGLVLGSVKE